jgi:Skp family chaperone for outer membrane proteins
MKTRRTALIVVAALVMCLTFGTAAAKAQEAAKVGIVNPAAVFAQMQETKDLKQKLENDRKALEQEVQSRQGKVKDLQGARDMLKADSPQYQDADKAFMQAAIEFDTWSKITQAQLQGQQKQQMKILFDKIVTATTQVAQRKGLDLVLADQRPELPENLAAINVDQLRAILNGRNVLYSTPRVDISNDVVAALDAQYRAGGGAGASSPAPAGGAAPTAPTTPAPAAPAK